MGFKLRSLVDIEERNPEARYYVLSSSIVREYLTEHFPNSKYGVAPPLSRSAHARDRFPAPLLFDRWQTHPRLRGCRSYDFSYPTGYSLRMRCTCNGSSLSMKLLFHSPRLQTVGNDASALQQSGVGLGGR